MSQYKSIYWKCFGWVVVWFLFWGGRGEADQMLFAKQFFRDKIQLPMPAFRAELENLGQSM